MDKEKFNKIEKILDSATPSGGGPLKVTESKCAPIIDFNNIVQGDIKKDFLVYVKYFPNEDRYGFAVYDKDSENKK